MHFFLEMSINFRSTLLSLLYVTLATSAYSFLLEIPENATFTGGSYLIPTELELFRNSLGYIKDNQCRRDLNATLWGLLKNEQWAVAMYDASVRNPVGIESSVLYQLGHYDQCLESHNIRKATNNIPQSVQAQYCLVDVPVSGVNSDDKTGTQTLITHWGECIPAVCNGDDIATFLQYTLQRNISVNVELCQLSRKDQPLTTGMIIFGCILFFFLILTFMGTVYHICVISSYRKEENIAKFKGIFSMTLLSFSVIENTKKLFRSNKNQSSLSSINGIKAIAMLLILCGHAAVVVYGIPLYNVDFIKESMKSPFFGHITNSLVFVDTFLLLSSYLFVRLVYPEMEKHRGRLNPFALYIARYIRLTPSYVVVIGFYMTWFTRVANGPLWPQRIEREQESCQSSWWLNLLYVNNYFNTDKLCMFQSWYLSADTQLFVGAPLIMLIVYKFRILGILLMIALAAFTSAIPFIVTYFKELPPSFIVYSKEAEYIPSSEFYKNTYIKTHMRASSYSIGLLAGYLGHQMNRKSTKLPHNCVRLLWTLSCVLGVGALFSIYKYYAAPYSVLESALYAALHKLAWNLSNAWLVLAVTTGNGGWVQRFLSSRAFLPFSRLSYCAYLVNGIVILVHTSTVRSPAFLNLFELDNVMLAYTIDTFLIALGLCLIFESPIHGLERMLRQSHSPRHRSDKSSSNNTNDITPATSEERVA